MGLPLTALGAKSGGPLSFLMLKPMFFDLSVIVSSGNNISGSIRNALNCAANGVSGVFDRISRIIHNIIGIIHKSVR